MNKVSTTRIVKKYQDKAKQKAEHWYCENVPYFWGEEHISEIKEFLGVFNVELTRYEYDTYTFSYRTDIVDSTLTRKASIQ